MVDKKKDKDINEEEKQTPEEGSEQLPGTDGTVDPDAIDSEEVSSTEDAAGEDISGEDVSAEDISGEDVSAKDIADEVVSDEPVVQADDAVTSKKVKEKRVVTARVVATDGKDVDTDASERPVRGVAAVFDHPKHLLAAAALTRDAEYKDFDAFSPFPIEGMDAAMGLGRSWIPWVTTAAAVTGFCLATAMQYGMMGVDWPLIIGGKAFVPWPSFVPVMFELSVLMAGTTTVGVMFKAAGCFKKPLIIDPRITDDRFALWISADDEKFDLDEALEFLENMNPLEVRKVVKDA